MKQHRCGTDIGFPLEACRHLEVRHHESPQKVVLSSADAQIVSDEFIMRFQTWTLVPWNRSDTFVEQLAKEDYMHDICVHGRLAGYPDGSKVTDHMISRVTLLENGEDCQTRLFQCPYCYMDYMVDAKDFGEQGFAVITTKWVNFGPGRESPDIKWRCHGTRYKDRLDVNDAACHGGEIRADFESQAEPSLEDLTSDNERRLFSTRKRRAITRAPDGRIWRWSGGARWFLDPPNSNPSIWERWLW
ncbi:hypothetical protein V492_00836 [Pseudogymnoascus sp. VKM F-4246]|nr:hypothetical protein V492_00836 [Pseudogymnoascus sp. VKM F-4246]